MATAGGVIVVEHPFNAERSAAAESAAHRDPAHIDTDGDGLSDAVELAGWTSGDGDLTRTDPRRADTDRDGLPDGLEAGEVSNGARPRVVVAGVSDPDDADTDGDRLRDADEYFLALDARARDTDRDGEDDGAEVKCGADPAAANPDGDSYSDSEECERGSDPLGFDLTRAQAAAAAFGGAAFGDANGAAQRVLHLNDAQTESTEYLLGQLASGFLAAGDVRDLIANIGQGDVVLALLSAGSLVPLAGDLTDVIATLTKFAKRGSRARQSVLSLTAHAPWLKSRRKQIVRAVLGASPRLPAELAGGPRTYVVYGSSSTSAERYIGITDNFARRSRQHAAARRSFTPEMLTDGLTRNQARTIEETCIAAHGTAGAGGALANRYHSISPTAPYYEEAVRYGAELLKRVGGACP